jgi:hypothetical protein
MLNINIEEYTMYHLIKSLLSGSFIQFSDNDSEELDRVELKVQISKDDILINNSTYDTFDVTLKEDCEFTRSIRRNKVFFNCALSEGKSIIDVKGLEIRFLFRNTNLNFYTLDPDVVNAELPFSKISLYHAMMDYPKDGVYQMYLRIRRIFEPDNEVVKLLLSPDEF